MSSNFTAFTGLRRPGLASLLILLFCLSPMLPLAQVAIPTVSVTATDNLAAKPGKDTGTFKVTRTGSLTSSLKVYFAFGGTALKGADYATSASPVVIPANAASANVMLFPKINPKRLTGDCTATLCLLANSSYVVGTPAKASVLIREDNHLHDGVDNENLVWRTSGSAPWFYERSFNHDGQDAVQSGAIANKQSSSLYTVVTGPAYISCWWQVKTGGNSALKFMVDGKLCYLSEGVWEKMSYFVGPGAHTIQWTYAKDNDKYVDFDCGWVDSIVITPFKKLDLNQALDSGLGWTVDPAGTEWFGQNAVTADGKDAAASGEVPPDKTAIMTAEVSGPAIIAYRWKLECPNYRNNLTLYSDNNAVTYLDGDMDWEQKTYIIPTGRHHLSFVYTQNSFETGGRAYVDDIQTIQLNAPKGGEKWLNGNTYTITWATSRPINGDTVKISLLKNGNSVQVISASTPNNGSFAWKVPINLAQSSNYQIQIASTKNLANGGHSGPLTITPIDVVAPAANTAWANGKTYQVKWNSNKTGIGSSIRVTLYKGGVFQRVITKGTPNTGSFSWMVPADLAPDNNYQLQLSSTLNSAITVNSPIFTVTPIVVLSPTAGENWFEGEQHTIRWDASPTVIGNTVRITIFQNGEFVKLINGGTANDGSYTWTIPVDTFFGYNYQITVAQKSDVSVRGDSQSFNIWGDSQSYDIRQ